MRQHTNKPRPGRRVVKDRQVVALNHGRRNETVTWITYVQPYHPPSRLEQERRDK